jgi:hypothetical protein
MHCSCDAIFDRKVRNSGDNDVVDFGFMPLSALCCSLACPAEPSSLPTSFHVL